MVECGTEREKNENENKKKITMLRDGKNPKENCRLTKANGCSPGAKNPGRFYHERTRQNREETNSFSPFEGTTDQKKVWREGFKKGWRRRGGECGK